MAVSDWQGVAQRPWAMESDAIDMYLHASVETALTVAEAM